MQTIKTASVVVLMLAVLYGVYVGLNRPDWPASKDLAWKDFGSETWDSKRAPDGLEDVRIEVGGGTDQGADDRGSDSKSGFTMPAMAMDRSVAPKFGASPPSGSPGGSGAQERLVDVRPPPGSPGVISPPSFVEPSAEQANPPAESADSRAVYASANDNPAGASAADSGKPTSDTAYVSDELPEGNATAAKAGDFVPLGQRDASSEQGSGAAPSARSASAERPLGARSFAKVWEAATEKLQQQQYYEALLTLSYFHDSPELTSEERQRLLDLLDPLAAKVVYSTEHHITGAYLVQRGDTLASIAEKHQVPAELLKNINGVEDPNSLPLGSQLKVMNGPFRAEIGLQRKELTLFIGRLYAGRFPLSIGNDPLPQPGEYQVREKSPGRLFVGADGDTLPPGDPNNPYGGHWLDLGNEMGIHGSPVEGSGGRQVGCLSLSPIDARDIYGILSEGSAVIIRE